MAKLFIIVKLYGCPLAAQQLSRLAHHLDRALSTLVQYLEPALSSLLDRVSKRKFQWVTSEEIIITYLRFPFSFDMFPIKSRSWRGWPSRRCFGCAYEECLDDCRFLPWPVVRGRGWGQIADWPSPLPPWNLPSSAQTCSQSPFVHSQQTFLESRSSPMIMSCLHQPIGWPTCLLTEMRRFGRFARQI